VLVINPEIKLRTLRGETGAYFSQE